MSFNLNKVTYAWCFQFIDGDGATYKSATKKTLAKLLASIPENLKGTPLISLVRTRPMEEDMDDEALRSDHWYPDLSTFSDFDDPPQKYRDEWKRYELDQIKD